MAIFAISDVIIYFTLLFNALALISFKMKQLYQQRYNVNINDNMNVMNMNDDTIRILFERFIALVYKVRRFSSLLVLWNLVFIICMIGVFDV